MTFTKRNSEDRMPGAFESTRLEPHRVPSGDSGNYVGEVLHHLRLACLSIPLA